jgi:hypothetical protein
MIKSSQTLVTSPVVGLSEPITPQANKSLRRAHSIESLSPRHPTLASLAAEYSEVPHTAGFSVAHVSAHHSPYLASPQRKPSSGHPRGMSFDAVPRLFSKSQVNLIASSSTLDLTGGGKQGKEKGAVVTKNISPTKFCSILTSTSSTQLDVEGLKKLRLLLRNEVASYVRYQCM